MLPALNWARDVPVVAFLGMVLTVTVPQLLNEADIQAPRPSAISNVRHEILADLERFDTRLWEDPRESIERGKRQYADAAGDGGKAQPWKNQSFIEIDQLRQWIEKIEKVDSVQILAISMNFGAHPENVEARRRTRFATYMAMTSAGYVPMDYQHIGAFHFGASGDDEKPRVEVPFERFEPQEPQEAKPKTNRPRIVVLWLDEDYFLDPNGTTAPGSSAQREAWGACTASATGQPGNAPPCPEATQSKPASPMLLALRDMKKCLGDKVITLVGPTTSDILKLLLLVTQDPERKKEGGPDAAEWLKIRSPSATAPATSFLEYVSPNVKQEVCPSTLDSTTAAAERTRATDCIRRIFKRQGIDFNNEVPDDRLVFQSIDAELRYRWCVRGTPQNPRFLIIGEADSFYAREFQRKEFVGQNGATGDAFCPTVEGNTNSALGKGLPEAWAFGRFTFLRDLNDPYIEDDIAAREKVAARSQGNAEKAPSTLSIATAVSEGDPQFDYVRRMALKMVHEESLKDGGVDGVFAIGIFGGDEYDKLTWLKALRPRFPKALFVTTDLDARLWDPQNAGTARNMIVGSSFGLDPNEPVPGDEVQSELPSVLPVFRRETQTAYFHAIRKAIDAPKGASRDTRLRGSEVIRVYELGLSDPHRLEQPQPFRPTDAYGTVATVKPLICGAGYLTKTFLFPAHIPELPRAMFQFVVVLVVSGILRYLAMPAVRFSLGGLRPALGQGLTRFRIGLVAAIAIGLFLSWWWGSKSTALMLSALLLPWFCPFWGRQASIDPDVPPPRFLGVRITLGLSVVLYLAWLVYLANQAFADACTGIGEPLVLLDGVSIWGATVIRILAIAVGLVALLTILGMLAQNAYRCRNEFGEFHPPKLTMYALIREFVRCAWTRKSPTTGDQSFHAYRAASHWIPMLAAGILIALVLLLATYGMFMMLGGPNDPTRGRASASLHQWTIISGGATNFVLLATLAFAVLTCRTWIQSSRSDRKGLPWASETMKHLRSKYSIIGPDIPAIESEEDTLLGSRFHVHLIALRTEVLTPLVYAPFLIIALLLIARWDQFDYTNEAKSVILMFTASILISVAIVVALRNSAKKVKEGFLEDMRAALHKVRQRLGTDGVTEQRIAALEALRSETEAEASGAFRPILEQPVVKGLLIVMGGFGIPQLAEVFKWLT